MSKVVVDIGKSGTRCWMNQVSAIAQGLPPSAAVQGGAGALLANGVRAAWRHHPDHEHAELVSHVVVGSTFLPAEDELAHAGEALRSVWPNAMIQITADGFLAHAYALGGPGVVASAGTGTTVVGVDEFHNVWRSDGWGPELGDRGSAWQIGLAGMRACYRQLDGVGPQTTLVEELAHYLGRSPDFTAAAQLLGERERVQRIAGFAPRVIAAAGSADATAHSILQAAVGELLATVVALAARCRTASVAFVGGLTAEPLWVREVTARCAVAGLQLVRPGSISSLDAEVLFRAPYAGTCSWSG